MQQDLLRERSVILLSLLFPNFEIVISRILQTRIKTLFLSAILCFAGIIIPRDAVAQCPMATITVEINTDQWGDETSWEIYDQPSLALIASGGNGLYNGNSTYTHQVCVDSAKCYFFIIYDAFSDGICCTYGLGSYTVRYNGTIVGTGGVFADSESLFNIGSCSGSGGNPLSTDNTTYTPPQLVTDVLLGSCVSAFNVQYTGENGAIGYFSNGAGIGMDDGILITSGNTDLAPGPNTFSDATRDWPSGGDFDLENAAGLPALSTQDAAALEFDFVSFNDTVTFRYIFASEEYPEYVCSPYNDAFAFLVSGTGYAPNKNIALIPGTNIAVAINSINNGSPGSLLYPPSNCTSLTNTAYYVANDFGNITEYDAYTVPLTATMIVVPCDTYHIKLVIADVGDGLYDSGVFLQAQSFSGGQSVNILATDNNGSKNTLEKCSDGRFTFSREDTSDVADQIVIYYTVSGTATEGTDYIFIPDSIIIPANQTSASLFINPIEDGISEGGESVILTYSDACACNSFKRDTIFIFDNSPLFVSLTGPTTICNGQSATLNAIALGSFSQPYSYEWSSGETTPSITVNPIAQTTYTVTVTDACAGQTATASRTINVASTTALFTVTSPQCFTQNDFDFTNTGNYTGTASFNWNLGNGTTRTTEDVLNYAYPIAGNYTVQLIISDLGCADTFSQNITLLDSFVTNVNAYICPDSAVFAGGAWQNTNGTYFDFLTAANGCDSTIVTVVSILQYQSQSRTLAICSGDSLFAGGDYQNTAGIYVDTLLSLAGCDTILTTNLSIDNYVTASSSSAICPGDYLFVGGDYQTTAGIYLDTIPALTGCDTIRTTNLSIDNYITASSSSAICPGDSLFVGGDYQTTAGIYLDTIPALTGCDTIRTTTLTLNSNIYLTGDISICAGDSVFAGNGYQTAAGSYYDTIAGTIGCDTILITNLTIRNPVSASATVTLCAGDSVFAGGDYQTTAGVYSDTFLASNGCDSILLTSVIVNDTFRTNISVYLCPGDSAYADGAWQTAPGAYSDDLLSAHACDSTVVTTVFINSFIQVQSDVPLCEGDSFFAGGSWQNVSGNYIDTFLASGGCDSVVTTVLTVYDTSVTTVAARICEGDSVFAGGAWQTLAGQYIDTLQSAEGCDSTVILNLSVDTVIPIPVNAAICAGESYFAGGALQTVSGIYADSFIASTGCDSIVTTTLTVADTFLQTFTVYICAGDSFFAAGAWQTQAGSYTDSLNSISSCDSVIITNLFIETVIEVFPAITICNGDSTFAGGAWQTQAGTFVDSFIATGGCDSVVTTSITVADTFYTVSTFTLCEGDSFFAGGAWQTTAGQYVDRFLSNSGCDSTEVYVLSFDTIPRSSSSEIICDGDSLFLENDWQTTSGVYTDTFLSSNGCDSIHTTTLTVNQIAASGFDATLCEDATTTLSVSGSYFSYLWNPGGETSAVITTGAGDYVLTVGDADGCSDTAAFRVSESLVSIFATPNDTTILQGASVIISILGGNSQLNYSWTPSTNLTCTDCSTSIATPDDDILYTISVTDSLGCTDVATVQIFVDTIPLPRIYVPNAFTPNGDGVNDAFFVYVKNELTFHLLIFDRWGEMLFETTNPLEGWNGEYRGKLCNPGVYVYYVDVKFADNTEPDDFSDYQKGSLTLIR